MTRQALAVLALAPLSSSCGKPGSGCERRPQQTEQSVRDRFAAYRGESGPRQDGRCGTIREQAGDDDDLIATLFQMDRLQMGFAEWLPAE